MVIGSGTSFRGSNINTDILKYTAVETSIHSKIIYVVVPQKLLDQLHASYWNSWLSKRRDLNNGKATIKKSATVVGTLRYEVISVEEGAMYSDLHCTKADQKLVDKISSKTMSQSN